MQLFLTSVLPFLAHNHASAAAFLTCRHHNFHSSIIPEFLSDDERVEQFCEARQKNELYSSRTIQYANLYNLFVQTPLMQFSPTLVLRQKDCAESILKPLLETKYFCRTLQRCSFFQEVEITKELLQGLSKVQSLVELDFDESQVKNHHLEIIVNSFPSLRTLTFESAYLLKPKLLSPPPPATKTLRNLTMRWIDPVFATQFIPNFPNLRKLQVVAQKSLDLLPLSSSLPLLSDLSLVHSTLENTGSLKNFVHLSSLHFKWCEMPNSLSFLVQENSLPNLTTLSIDCCEGLSTSSFASLVHAPNLQVLEVVRSEFNNDCLQYLEDMVHLRKLDLSLNNKLVGDSRPLKPLMQNLFQLEELDLHRCRIGGQGAIAGALYSTHSRLRILNLENCSLVDDDLDGIGALKNTLEDLNLSFNGELTSEALVHCKDLVKLKILGLNCCDGIDDVSPLKGCVNLEELNVSCCDRLTDDSFKVFNEEPNSFPNLRVLDLQECENVEGQR